MFISFVIVVARNLKSVHNSQENKLIYCLLVFRVYVSNQTLAQELFLALLTFGAFSKCINVIVLVIN